MNLLKRILATIKGSPQEEGRPSGYSWSEYRQMMASGAFDFIPGSRFDFKVDIAIPREDWADREELPHQLAQELIDELRDVEALWARGWYQPYGAPWPWPDDEPKYPYLPLPAPTPDWVVYVGLGAGAFSAGAALPVYINGMKAVVRWLRKTREGETDERLKNVTLKLTSKKGMVIDYRVASC